MLAGTRRTYLIDLNNVRQGNRIQVAREDELCSSLESLTVGETVRVVDEEEGLGYATIEGQTSDEVVLRIDWDRWRKGQTAEPIEFESSRASVPFFAGSPH